MATSKYHHGDLKRALTDAALTLVAEKGPKGFTLTEAARRAGVSVAAPYRHFADKNALLAAVAEDGFRLLDVAIQESAGTTSDPLTALTVMSVAYVGWAVRHPDQFRVMFGSELDKSRYPELRAVADRAFASLLTALTGAQQQHLLSGDDPRQLAGPLWALVHGVATLAVDGALNQMGLVEPPEHLVERAAADWLAAIRTTS